MALLGKSIDFLFNQMRSYQGTLAGGTIEFYLPSSTTPAPVYLDVNLLQQAANPYMLSADGTAELFGNGVYRIIVKNAQGVIVFDYDWVEIVPMVVSGTGGGGTGGTVGHYFADCQLTTPTTTLNPTDQLQYWTRTGDSTYPAILLLPAGKTFYSGAPSFTLYSDGETTGFLLFGDVYYPLVT